MPTFVSDNARIPVTAQGVVTIPAKYYGTANITVSMEAEGIYNAAQIVVTVNVGPDKPSVSNLTAGSNSLTVKWKKTAGASGYEIQYSGLKNFSLSKTVRANRSSAVSKTVKSLTRDATYYVRVRSFRNVNGVRAYSPWSSTKSIEITKGKAAPTLPALQGLRLTPDLNYKTVKARMVAEWTAAEDAAGYEIGYRYKKTDGKWSSWSVAAVDGNKPMGRVSVKHGVQYAFRVRAVKRLADGSPIYSAWSASKSGMASFEPQLYTYCYTTNTREYYIPVVIQNVGVVPFTIEKNAKFVYLYAPSNKYDLIMYAYITEEMDTPREATSLTLAPGKTAVVYYRMKGFYQDFYLDKSSMVTFNLTCEGLKYTALAYSQDYEG